MQKRPLGRSGLNLNPIGLGAMPLSIQGHPDETSGINVIRKAIELGADFIDTANAYCTSEADTGRNERLIAKALKELGSATKVTIATKGGCVRPNGDWAVDARPASLRKACEKSLMDLGVSTIALYYLHAPDAKVPFADSVGELSKLKQEGKIAHVGLSNVSSAQLKDALKIVRIEAVQNRCNPDQKTDFQNGLVDLCKKEQVAYVAHSPVGGHRGHSLLTSSEDLKELSKKYGQSPYALCLQWLLAQSENVFVIPGASKVSSITDSLKAGDFKLDAEDLEKIAAI